MTKEPSANGTGSTRDSAGRHSGSAKWKMSSRPLMQMAMAAMVTPTRVPASASRGRWAKGTASGSGRA